MPWKAGDVERHIKGLSTKQAAAWLKIANSTRDRCVEGGGDEKDCDAQAIRVANAAAKNVKEADVYMWEGIIAKLKEAGMNKEAIESLTLVALPSVLARLTEAEWDVAYINDLPDSAFLYVGPGGEKDEDGKTVPRSLRYFPVYDSEGSLNLPHLRNALARIPQSSLDKAAKDKATAKAQALAKKNLPTYKEAGDESHEELRRQLGLALRDRMGLGSASEGPWVRDVYDDYLIYDFGGKTYQLDYSEDANGKITVGDPTEVVARTVYEPVAESIGGDVIPLSEQAVAKDGTAEIKIIQPGWGSSGFYSKEMLRRDASIYKPGLHMYWDHPTESEDRERPERSLRDLAGELISTGAFREDGPRGPGVYAKAKVFGPYREAIEELAPHIGVSHRALGKAVSGEAEGRKGPIIEKLVAAKSVDYITTPGAGGQVVQLFESARDRAREEDRESDKGKVEMEEAKRMEEEKVKELEEAKTGLEREKTELAEENARLKESAILREARDTAVEKVGASDLPEITRARLVETLVRSPAIKEGKLDREEYEKDIEEAIKSESDYIAKITGSGEIRGMGAGGDDSGKAKLKESFKATFIREGRSDEEAERMAEIAAQGR
jgi:hypothetical protein